MLHAVQVRAKPGPGAQCACKRCGSMPVGCEPGRGRANWGLSVVIEWEGRIGFEPLLLIRRECGGGKSGAGVRVGTSLGDGPNDLGIGKECVCNFISLIALSR